MQRYVLTEAGRALRPVLAALSTWAEDHVPGDQPTTVERHYGHDPETLRRQIRHVVLHEIAHHFGISDERLIELDRY